MSARMTSDAKKQKILASYGVEPSQLLGSGMEAEVYALGDDEVLKLYDAATSINDLRGLQKFYSQLDDSALTYSLPQIRQLKQRYDYTITIEKRLLGRPLADVIEEHHTAGQLDALFEIYLTAVNELSRLKMPSDAKFYKLFDVSNISVRSAGDWHRFLLHCLDEKLAELASYLERDVADYERKVGWIRNRFSKPYTDSYRLIHGDFYPGNLLVDEQTRATAVIDFGLFTMYGDRLFDVATAWVFFDMYDELKADVRERLLKVTLHRFGNDICEKLYLYVLLYSFLSANTYFPYCSDGHYVWCVANLNNREYWKYIAE